MIDAAFPLWSERTGRDFNYFARRFPSDGSLYLALEDSAGTIGIALPTLAQDVVVLDTEFVAPSADSPTARAIVTNAISAAAVASPSILTARSSSGDRDTSSRTIRAFGSPRSLRFSRWIRVRRSRAPIPRERSSPERRRDVASQRRSGQDTPRSSSILRLSVLAYGWRVTPATSDESDRRSTESTGWIHVARSPCSAARRTARSPARMARHRTARET